MPLCVGHFLTAPPPTPPHVHKSRMNWKKTFGTNQITLEKHITLFKDWVNRSMFFLRKPDW